MGRPQASPRQRPGFASPPPHGLFCKGKAVLRNTRATCLRQPANRFDDRVAMGELLSKNLFDGFAGLLW